MCSIGGYAHEKVLSTRYSGCWVLASAVALLAIVVVVLSSVVILLATVVTNTLSDLVLRGFRACWDLLRISIWSIEDRPIGSGLWITGIKQTRFSNNLSWRQTDFQLQIRDEECYKQVLSELLRMGAICCWQAKLFNRVCANNHKDIKVLSFEWRFSSSSDKPSGVKNRFSPWI